MENLQYLATIIEACMYSIEKMYPNKLITTYIYIFIYVISQVVLREVTVQ